MKRCSRCGIEKELEEFSKNHRSKDGKQSRCKVCRAEEDKKYYLAHKEVIISRVKLWKSAHVEEMKDYKKSYAAKNKEEIAVYKKDYHVTHKAEHAKYHREYRIRRKGDLEKKRRNYYDTHKERIKTRVKEYQNTPEGKMVKSKVEHKRRSVKKDTERSLTTEQWQKIIELQRNRCVLCGKLFTKKNPATKDHIIPVIPYNGAFTRENTQAAHASCNARKSNHLDRSNIVVWISALAQEI